MGEIFIVKNKMDSNNSADNAKILMYAKESLEKQEERTYYTAEKDGIKLREREGQEGIIMLVSYTGKGEINLPNVGDTEIESIYIGEMIVSKDRKNEEKYNIVCSSGIHCTSQSTAT